MKKTFFKQPFIVFSTLALLGYGLVWACAWGGWDEYDYSAYAPEAFVAAPYSPFFLSDEFYYGIGHDAAHVHRFDEEVSADWANYLGLKQDSKELAFLLFEASAHQVDSVRTAFKNTPLASQSDNKKAKAFLQWLSFAKANEAYAATSVDYWRYDEPTAPLSLNEQQLAVRAAMEEEMHHEKDKFLKQRYFFQVVRAYFFAGEYEACIQQYQALEKEFPANSLAYRSMSYAAGAHYKLHQYAEANYLYSKVYDGSALLKTVAHYSFHPQEEADWQRTLTLCHNKSEQITLWHLLGIYYDEQQAIKEIYALDPKSEKLELLLSRLVNLQEKKNANDWGTYRSASAKDSLGTSALSLVQDIATAGNTAKPYIWSLSAGYLHFLNGDFEKAQLCFQQAKLSLPQTALPQAQLRLFVLLNRVAAAKQLDLAFEQQVLPDLLWLQGLEAAAIANFRFQGAYTWLKSTISLKYKAQGDVLKAELFGHQDSFYAQATQTAAMKAFLSKAQHSPFEQYGQSIYPISAADISEFQAVLLTFDDQLDAAIPFMDAAGDETVLLGNPFNGTIKDCHDCDHAAPQKIKYTKLSLLQKMKEMKQNVSKGIDVYNNSLLLGNAYYNITHFGNARLFYEGKIIGTGYSSASYVPECFRSMVVQQSLAQGYYEKALAAATNEEQKAKMTYLLLKVERNNSYLKTFESTAYNSWDWLDIPRLSFHKLLPYKHTKYYSEVLQECGYFKKYLSTKR